MVDKLPSNSRNLLKEIVKTDDPVEMLKAKFENCTRKEDTEIRGMIRELKEKGLIEVHWADNRPYDVQIHNSGLTYFERESEYEKLQDKAYGTTVNIDSMNATGGNVVFGNAINSTFNINNSVKEIEKKIDELGGEDKIELKEILDEVKDLIENIEETRLIQKNKNLSKRINQHVVKHGWFYGAILQLIGTEAVALLAK